MKYRLIALSLVGLACAAHADVYTYSSALTGTTGASGSATITIDSALKTMAVDVSFSALSSNVTAAHIHCCTASSGSGSAGVAVNFTGFPLGTTSGSYSHLFDMSLTSTYGSSFLSSNGGTADGAFAALIAGFDRSMAYVNVHSSSNPAGEISGFPSAVPEPASFGLMALGLSALGLAARRRRLQA